jgi:hypothetical protein
MKEQAKRGREARKVCPRSAHAVWIPPENRPDPINLLEAQTATRIPELLSIRYGRMLVSPFAFYRGAAAIMASDLSTMPNTGLKVQLCGDAHLSNFGGFASPERDLILDVNDFNQTLSGPWEWDVKRLVTSVAITGRGLIITRIPHFCVIGLENNEFGGFALIPQDNRMLNLI